MNKKRRNQWIMAFIVSALALGSTLAVKYIYESRMSDKEYGQQTIAQNNEEDNSLWDWEHGDNYAFETVYAGDPYMQESLYLFEFDRGEYYRSNKEIASQLSSEEMSAISQKVKDFWTTVFNFQYKSDQLSKQLDTFSDMIHPSAAIGAEASIYEAGGDDIISLIANEVVSKHISVEGDFLTDKSLVYSTENIPGSYTVRGLLHFTVIEADDMNMIESILGLSDVTLGQEYSYIIETELSQGIDVFNPEDERITGFSIVAEKN